MVSIKLLILIPVLIGIIFYGSTLIFKNHGSTKVPNNSTTTTTTPPSPVLIRSSIVSPAILTTRVPSTTAPAVAVVTTTRAAAALTTRAVPVVVLTPTPPAKVVTTHAAPAVAVVSTPPAVVVAPSKAAPLAAVVATTLPAEAAPSKVASTPPSPPPPPAAAPSKAAPVSLAPPLLPSPLPASSSPAPAKNIINKVLDTLPWVPKVPSLKFWGGECDLEGGERVDSLGRECEDVVSKEGEHKEEEEKAQDERKEVGSKDDVVKEVEEGDGTKEDAEEDKDKEDEEEDDEDDDDLGPAKNEGPRLTRRHHHHRRQLKQLRRRQDQSLHDILQIARSASLPPKIKTMHLLPATDLPFQDSPSTTARPHRPPPKKSKSGRHPKAQLEGKALDDKRRPLKATVVNPVADLHEWINSTVDQSSKGFETVLTQALHKVLLQNDAPDFGQFSGIVQSFVNPSAEAADQDLPHDRIFAEVVAEAVVSSPASTPAPTRTTNSNITTTTTTIKTATPPKPLPTFLTNIINTFFPPFLLQFRADLRNLLLWICSGTTTDHIDGRIAGDDTLAREALQHDRQTLINPKDGSVNITDLWEPHVAVMAWDCIKIHWEGFKKEFIAMVWNRYTEAREFLIQKLRLAIGLPEFLIRGIMQLMEGGGRGQGQGQGQGQMEGESAGLVGEQKVEEGQDWATWIVGAVMDTMNNDKGSILETITSAIAPPVGGASIVPQGEVRWEGEESDAEGTLAAEAATAQLEEQRATCGRRLKAMMESML